MSAMSATVAWILSAMVSWSPPDRVHTTPDAVETADSAQTRYEEIAKSLTQVAYAEGNTPIFSGSYGRARTAALMVSVAYHESGFRRDVDLGIGKAARGDGGKSHCMMQINLGLNRVSTVLLENLLGQPWSANDLVEDRTKCFQTGYAVLYKSFSACKSLPFEYRMAIYASGTCYNGHYDSAVRVRRAVRWFSGHKPPFDDVVVLTSIAEEEHPSQVDDVPARAF